MRKLSYVKILIKINKEEQFNKFLEGFEFNDQKERTNKKNENDNIYLKPIIEPSQKYIILDKKVFGEELFYSGELKPMGTKAVKMIENEFDWIRIAERLVEIYSKREAT